MYCKAITSFKVCTIYIYIYIITIRDQHNWDNIVHTDKRFTVSKFNTITFKYIIKAISNLCINRNYARKQRMTQIGYNTIIVYV